MNWIWTFHIRQIKKLLYIMIAAFITANLFATPQLLHVFSPLKEPVAFYRGEIEDKRIALTFNIEQDEQQVKEVVNLLKSKNIEQATFFIMSSWAERNPELTEKIFDSKYTIGSYGHERLHYMKEDEMNVREDMIKSKLILNRITGYTPNLLRPPEGFFDKKTLHIANDLDYSVVLWSANTSANIAIHPGDVILFPFSDGLENLSAFIDQLRKDGFSFTSIEELMASTNTTHEEIN